MGEGQGKMVKIHFRNMRYFNNAGIRIAECVARQDGLLDTSSRVTTGEWDKVTCKKCLKYKENKE